MYFHCTTKLCKVKTGIVTVYSVFTKEFSNYKNILQTSDRCFYVFHRNRNTRVPVTQWTVVRGRVGLSTLLKC